MELSRLDHKSLCREAIPIPETETLVSAGDLGEGKTCPIPNKTTQKGYKINASGKFL